MKNKKRPTGFRQPAREFSFQLQPPTNYNNGDEIVLTLIEDGVTTTWKTYLFDSGLCMHPDEAEFCLNRGDYTLMTSAGDYYPANPNAKELQLRDEDETLDFHKVLEDEGDEVEEEEENKKGESSKNKTSKSSA